MLTAGGVSDQPAARWSACQRAGGIYQILERINAKGFDFSAMTENEREMQQRSRAVEIDLTELDAP